jgi:Cu+-exporting ATPase
VDSAAALLRYAGAVENAAEHPIARAIAAAAPELLPVTDFVALPGLGAQGTVDGHRVVVGQAKLLASQGIQVSTVDGIAVAWDGVYRGYLTVADTVRPSSAGAVARLKAMGLRPVLLTGDSRAVAEAVAEEVGIDEVTAEVLPEEKVALVRDLQARGYAVAMVGDGVNDAAALAAADLGIAMGTGTDVAIEASDLTLVRADLDAAADAIDLSRATLRTIRGNLFWAFGYNVAALPLAAAGLVTPVVAAAAMALSSLFVVANSLRLRRR